MKEKFFPLVIFLVLIIFSCATTKYEVQNPNQNPNPKIQNPQEQENLSQEKITRKELVLVFAGDIMAHSVNFRPGRFSEIWDEVRDFVSQSDFAFANIEAPVNDDLAWATYPQFNMKSEYVLAAKNAGFNCFSLANNHTNDQSKNGIEGTRKFFLELEKKSQSEERKIFACGLRENDLSFRILEKNGWKILFCAITEILNSPDSKEKIDYFPMSQKNHEFLIEKLKRLKQENNCDLTIFSVHTDEAEYISEITKTHENFFNDLISLANVDIVWANHPHIIKKIDAKKIESEENFEENATQKNSALIMFANGNTISGQRTKLDLDFPEKSRQETGDGIILKVTVKENKNFLKDENQNPFYLEIQKPLLITTYVTPDNRYVIKTLDSNFINSFRRLEFKKEAQYFENRKKIIEERLNVRF